LRTRLLRSSSLRASWRRTPSGLASARIRTTRHTSRIHAGDHASAGLGVASAIFGLGRILRFLDLLGDFLADVPHDRFGLEMDVIPVSVPLIR
jgi:hypothetical protein